MMNNQVGGLSINPPTLLSLSPQFAFIQLSSWAPAAAAGANLVIARDSFHSSILNHLPSGIRTLVMRIQLEMTTFCAVSRYTCLLREGASWTWPPSVRYLDIPACCGKETAAVAENNLLLQSLSLSRECFVFLRYRRSLIVVRPTCSRCGRKQNGRERKGKERGSCGAETQYTCSDQWKARISWTGRKKAGKYGRSKLLLCRVFCKWRKKERKNSLAS